MFLNEYTQNLNGPYGPLDMTAQIDVNFLNGEIAVGRTLQEITDHANQIYNKKFTIPNIMDALDALPGKYGSLLTDQQLSESTTAAQNFAAHQAEAQAYALAYGAATVAQQAAMVQKASLEAQQRAAAAQQGATNNIDQMLFNFATSEIAAGKSIEEMRDDINAIYQKQMTSENVISYLQNNNLYFAWENVYQEIGRQKALADVAAKQSAEAQQQAAIAAQIARAQQDQAIAAQAAAMAAAAQQAQQQGQAITAQQQAAINLASQLQTNADAATKDAAQKAAAAVAAQKAAAAAAAEALKTQQNAASGMTGNLTPLLLLAGAALLLRKL
jgi:hypothetical protein